VIQFRLSVRLVIYIILCTRVLTIDNSDFGVKQEGAWTVRLVIYIVLCTRVLTIDNSDFGVIQEGAWTGMVKVSQVL
jgi:uncharacterized protein YlaI